MVRHHVIALACAMSSSLSQSAIPLSTAVTQSGANQSSQSAIVLPAQLRAGDLIYRSGRGWRSDAVRVAAVSSWTHVGIIDIDDGRRIFVIHAAPPDNGRPGLVVRETLDSFIARKEADRVHVERPSLSQQRIDGMVTAARRYAARRTAFDDAFDLSDDRALYCTELVWRSLATAGENRPARTRYVPIPLMANRFMTPDDLRAMFPGREILPSAAPA